MKFLPFFVAILIMANFSFAQDYNSPEQIFKIMEASENNYQVGILQEKLEANYTTLNQHGLHIIETAEGTTLTSYNDQMSAKAKKLLAKGEKFFTAKNNKKAEKFYRKALAENPNNSKLMVYIGQMQEVKKDFESAEEWYRKATKANYLDYMGHWFLADNLLMSGNSKEAIKEVTIAHVLNRNNPRIILSLIRIFKANGLEFSDQYFIPQTHVGKPESGQGEIVVDYAGTPWLAYGMCKATWEYEPNFRTDRDPNAPEGFSELEEKECLLNALSIYDSLDEKEKEDFPEMKYLSTVFDANKITEFIFYELWLPQQPVIIAMIGEQGLMELVAYVINQKGKPVEK